MHSLIQYNKMLTKNNKFKGQVDIKELSIPIDHFNATNYEEIPSRRIFLILLNKRNTCAMELFGLLKITVS